MDRSDFLFARPSFLKGIGSVLNIGATGNIYNSSKSATKADSRAIASDWQTIGNDMREALDEYKKETEK